MIKKPKLKFDSLISSPTLLLTAIFKWNFEKSVIKFETTTFKFFKTQTFKALKLRCTLNFFKIYNFEILFNILVVTKTPKVLETPKLELNLQSSQIWLLKIAIKLKKDN